ncbi:hypothetical protein AB1Y20_007729 [Prymnesium parvum]|uniref:Uncharacterized protein n=1 Tax=Prymnesium parvum TaxID=97485 RepID=A0AB34IW73_PRYPA
MRAAALAAALLFAHASTGSPSPPREQKRRLCPTFPQAASLAGLWYGERSTPAVTREMYPGFSVRTAEAWRRKIKQRKPIPLARRAPRILATSAAFGLGAEWLVALPAHGPLGALKHTQAARAIGALARSRLGQSATLLVQRVGGTGLRSKLQAPQ